MSTSAQAGRAAGLRVDRYTVTTYVLAATCYATAGILLAGYVRTPALDIGNPYLLATITAVVIGGTPLGGGRGSVIETALAALFLTQLTFFTDALSAPVDDPARAGRRDRGRRTRPERGRRRRRAPRNCLPAETKTCIKALRQGVSSLGLLLHEAGARTSCSPTTSPNSPPRTSDRPTASCTRAPCSVNSPAVTRWATRYVKEPTTITAVSCCQRLGRSPPTQRESPMTTDFLVTWRRPMARA